MFVTIAERVTGPLTQSDSGSASPGGTWRAKTEAVLKEPKGFLHKEGGACGLRNMRTSRSLLAAIGVLLSRGWGEGVLRVPPHLLHTS